MTTLKRNLQSESKTPAVVNLLSVTWSYGFKSVNSLKFIFLLLLIPCFMDSTAQNTVYTPLYNSGNFVKTIDFSKPVGDIDGSVSATTSGGVTYSIPIYTCPGTNGVQPSISLTYNSQSTSGIAGAGWNISGLSVISRGGRDLYHDAILRPVTYGYSSYFNSSDDVFLLDGNRLNALSAYYGGNLVEYRTEAETFSKIVSYTIGTPNNPNYFRVTNKNGSVLEFGNSVDSRFLTDDGLNVIYWRLNKIIDVNGNYIEFKYDNSNRDSRILQILYTGNSNTGLLPYNQLNFSYSVRTDQNKSYETGATIAAQYLLDKITVVHTNDLNVTETVKTYKLNYGFDNVSSMLKEVVEFGGDESSASLNSTIFLYGDNPQNTAAMVTDILAGSSDFFSGDFDADGKSDIIQAAKYYNQYLGTFLNTSYTVLKDINQSSATVMYQKTLPQGTTINNINQAKLFNFLASDYDGDGRDDIIQLNTDIVDLQCGQYSRKLTSIVLNLTKSFNNQTGYYDHVETTLPYPTATWGPFEYSDLKGNFFIPGDFDGDGSQDYILLLGQRVFSGFMCPASSQPMYQYNFKAFLTSPRLNIINKEISSFGIGPTGNFPPDYYANSVAEADHIDVMDFDGDGKMEILITQGQKSYVLQITNIDPYNTTPFYSAGVIYETTSIPSGSKIFLGDLNGDKKTDVLVRNPGSGAWSTLYSTGKTFSSFPFTFNTTVAYSNGNITDKILVSDFNGDGKADILHGYNNGNGSSSNLSIYYSRGVNSTAVFYNEVYPYSYPLGPDNLIAGDFNGDGRADFLNRRNIFAGGVDFVSIKPMGQERLLQKLTTGHNVTTAFNYKLLTDKSTYPWFYDRTISLDDPSNGIPFNYIQLPIYALSSLTSPDGIGGSNINEYSYENAVVHRTARGFIGFKKVTVKNNVSGTNKVFENGINTQFALAYNVRQTVSLTSTNQLLSESQNTVSFQNLGTSTVSYIGDYIRYFLKHDKGLSIDYLNGKAAESVNTYDSYGNITNNVSKVGILAGNTVTPTETTTTASAFSIHNTPVPAWPDNISITNVRAGMASISTTTAFTYTTNGLRASETGFSGLPKAVTISYTYNNFGNPLTAATSSAGLNNRTVNSTYDPKGRFVTATQKTGSGLSQTESFIISSKWGLELSRTSTDCLTTTNEYNAFGELTHTVLPDGNDVTISNNWQTTDIFGSPNPNKLFYTYAHYAGGKPDTKVYINKFGKEWRNETVSMYGAAMRWHTVITTYDNRGNVKTKTNPHFPNVPVPDQDPPPPYLQPVETPRITTYNYDAYNRTSSIVSDLGTTNYSYSQAGNGKMQTSITNPAGQTSSQIIDATGKIVNAIDNGGQLDFTYDSRDNQTEAKRSGTALISSVYDQYGKQTSSTDINAGTIIYDYDAYGQLKQQTDALGNTYNMGYDDFGRLITRAGPEGTTTYEYYKDLGSGCSNDNISKITGFNGIVKEYTFDALKRPATETQTVDGTGYTTSYLYTSYSQPSQTTYPSGLAVFQTYDASGYLVKVYHSGPMPKNTMFSNGWVNGEGKYLTYGLGWGKTTNNTYNKDFPTTTVTTGVQNLSYSFDLASRNLLQRTDNLKNQTEYFGYDNLNRLISTTPNSTQQSGITYDASGAISMGNIVAKTDAGYYKYRNDKINAVAYIMNTPVPGQQPVTPVPNTQISGAEQQISYTPFLKVASIGEGSLVGGPVLQYVYGPDYKRIKSELWEGHLGLTETKYYLGNYEKQIKMGVTREIHYINGGNGLCAMIVKEAGIITSYIVYTDHLGSITTVTNLNGSVIIAEQDFDAWGRNRNPSNWNDYNTVPDPPEWLYRGYTGHEMMPKFSLINMNGRMYDPILGRMLSPDNVLQAPFNSQNYNRYAYCLNNPLKYKDPSGDIIVIDSWLQGFIRGLFQGGFKGAWNEANKSAANDARIWGGLFAGNFKQIFSRFTWEAPQTLFGFIYSSASNTFGRVEDVKYYDGATIVRHRSNNGLGVTLGSYINGDNSIRPDPSNSLFQHEYGHYLQSQKSGLGYLAKFAIPSLLSKNSPGHSAVYNPVEQDANVRAIEYFYDKTGGNFQWRFHDNPIGKQGIGTNWTMADYHSIDFQQLLYLSRLQVGIQDYIGGWFVPGIIHAIQNNKTY